MVKICLNLLFKDDEQVLQRCFESISPLIDYFVVCDIGSSDNSGALVEEWTTPGVILKEKFVNYSYNKNLLLIETETILSKKFGDWYVLFVDPSDILVNCPKIESLRGNISFFRGYFRSERNNSKKIVIIKLGEKFKWYGTTCEVLLPKANGRKLPSKTLKDFIVEERNDCSRHTATGKHFKNLILLEGDLKVKHSARTLFYLAISYKKTGIRRLLPVAEKLFVERSKIKFFPPEIYVSLFNASSCRIFAGIYDEIALNYLMEAIKYDETRLEAPYFIMFIMLKRNNIPAAKALGRSFIKYTRGKIYENNLNSFFCLKEVYSWAFLHTLATTLYNSNEKSLGRKLLKSVDLSRISAAAKEIMSQALIKYS